MCDKKNIIEKLHRRPGVRLHNGVFPGFLKLEVFTHTFAMKRQKTA